MSKADIHSDDKPVSVENGGQCQPTGHQSDVGRSGTGASCRPSVRTDADGRPGRIGQAPSRLRLTAAAEQRAGSHRRLLRLITASILIAGCYILSPILRVPGMAPVQHLFNVTGAVLLGPWYNLVNALIVSGLRMTTMGITPLAVTGSVFGAVLSGLFYRYSGSILTATVGEVIGTGIIGSLASYPVMTLIAGQTGLNWLFYTPSFIMGTLIGGGTAFVILGTLMRTGQLGRFQQKLGTDIRPLGPFQKLPRR